MVRPLRRLASQFGDVTGLSLGCGDPIAIASLEPGQTVLDLGSGGGIEDHVCHRIAVAQMMV